MGPATARWRDALAAWAIPDPILDAAPRPPWGFSVATFARIADRASERDLPLVHHARAALPPGGAVLDVGCGAGAGSLPLAERAGLFVGVDSSPDMLDAFAERARTAGVAVRTIAGRWPDAAASVAPVDVAIARNVAYNVPDLDRFVTALTERARSRVVLELHHEHPMSWTAPFWRALHGLERPTRPTAADALAVLTEVGIDYEAEEHPSPFLLADDPEEEIVGFLLKQLCLGPERGEEVRSLLAAHPPASERPAVTAWWPGAQR